MTLTPNTLLIAARALVLLIPILLISAIGGLEFIYPALARSILSEPLVHVGCGFGYSLVFYVAFPRMRRGELTAMAVTALVAMNLPLAYLNFGAGLFTAAANIAGGLAALIPGHVERWRHLLRAHPYRSFSDIARDDRRRTQSFRRLDERRTQALGERAA